jgi:phosphoserine aminotransferase
MARPTLNFNPGPAILPLDVLKIVQQELLDYKGTGMSVLEISHRSADYEEINNAAVALTKEVLGLRDGYQVLFMGGGASTQFAVIPMNFLSKDKTAAYVDTGSWANKAAKEAKLFGNVNVVASSKEDSYKWIPKLADIKVPSDAVYLHVTSNNTIYGTQWDKFPDTGNIPLICDMSSDICSRTRDFNKFSLIYAGAQKNIGPAGVTMIIIRDEMLAKCKDGNPTMLDYRTHAKENSLYNTPPVFAVYVVRLVLEWIKKQGGLAAVEKVNLAKKERIYQMVDLHSDFYKGTVNKDSRSWMNLTFRLPSEDLEKKFIAEAKAAKMIGLKGHRSVGGVRVSLYNAMDLEGADKLAGFMESFCKANK